MGVSAWREGGGLCRPSWGGGVGEGTFLRRLEPGLGSESPPEAAPASWLWAWQSPRAAQILLPNHRGGNKRAAQSFATGPRVAEWEHVWL